MSVCACARACVPCVLCVCACAKSENVRDNRNLSSWRTAETEKCVFTLCANADVLCVCLRVCVVVEQLAKDTFSWSFSVAVSVCPSVCACVSECLSVYSCFSVCARECETVS